MSRKKKEVKEVTEVTEVKEVIQEKDPVSIISSLPEPVSGVAKIEPTMRAVFVPGTTEFKSVLDQIKNTGNNCVVILCLNGLEEDQVGCIDYAVKIGLNVCVSINKEFNPLDINRLVKHNVSEIEVLLSDSKEIADEMIVLMDKISEERSFNVRLGITRNNCDELEVLATKIVQFKPLIVRFMLAEARCGITGKEYFKVLERAGQGLNSAIPILENSGTGVDVVNFPMCHIKPEYRRCICNTLHELFSPYGNSACIVPKTEEYYQETTQQNVKSQCMITYPSVCITCHIVEACGGIRKSLVCEDDKTAAELVIPDVESDIIKDLMFYRIHNIRTMFNPYPEKLPCLPGVRGESVSGEDSIIISQEEVAMSSPKKVNGYEAFPVSKETLVAAGLPEDFGPDHVDWGIPSKMNRYRMAIASGDLKTVEDETPNQPVKDEGPAGLNPKWIVPKE